MIYFQKNLLEWYDQNHRKLPWRYAPGMLPNPYHVLLSEIMLQQTTVATVLNYFPKFIKKWPTIEDLARAELDEVYHLWQGLGYYSRAKNLHKCAQEVLINHKGIIPDTHDELIKLPGIGPYTSAAIGAIAFELPHIPVDGNIIRVFSRLLAISTPLPNLKDEIFEIVKNYVTDERRGDLAQALMDLGATVCKPRSPKCEICPIKTFCLAFKRDTPIDFPKRKKKDEKPRKYGYIYWFESVNGEIAIRKRPPKGLLANLMEFPGTEWTTNPSPIDKAIKEAPCDNTQWICLPTKVKHTFTHFHLELTILKGVGAKPQEGEILCHPRNFENYAFPTLMKKVMNTVNSI